MRDRHVADDAAVQHAPEGHRAPGRRTLTAQLPGAGDPATLADEWIRRLRALLATRPIPLEPARGALGNARIHAERVGRLDEVNALAAAAPELEVDARPAGLGDPFGGAAGEQGVTVRGVRPPPDGIDHEARGTAEAARWVARTAWLRAHGVAGDFRGNLTLATHPEIVRAAATDLHALVPTAGGVNALAGRLSLPLDRPLAGRPSVIDVRIPPAMLVPAGAAPAPAPAPAPTITAGGGRYQLPAGTTDAAEIQRVLDELLAGAPAGAGGGTDLGERDVAALRALGRDADLMTRMRRHGRGGPRGSLADEIEIVQAQRAVERAGGSPPGHTAGATPPVSRPVHGYIRQVQGTDAMVRNVEARFEFVTVDHAEVFAWPQVTVRWHLLADGDAQPIAQETTEYMDQATGSLRQRPFATYFPNPGRYRIRAVVHHAYYHPNTFESDPITVLTEDAMLSAQAQRAMGDWIEGPVRSQPHQFDVTRYGAGHVAHGQLSAAALAQPAGDTNVRSIDGELTRLRALVAQYRARPDERSQQIVTFANRRIEQLDAARRHIGSHMHDRNVEMVRCRAAYASRTPGVSSSDLQVTAWLRPVTITDPPVNDDEAPFTRTAEYAGTIYDHTQLWEPRNYELAETRTDREQTLEALFVALTRQYPDGTLTLACDLPGGRFVQFTRHTDTVGRDIRNVVFSPAVQTVVNLASVVLSAIPATAPLGIGVGIAYNTAATLDQLEQQWRNGTLDRREGARALGLLAMDLLPFAGAGAGRMIRLSRAGQTTLFHAVTATQLAGSTYLVSEQAMADVERLRGQQVASLAGVEDRLRELRAQNPSDPQIAALSTDAERLREELRTAADRRLGELVREQAIMVVATSAVQTLVSASVTRHVQGLALRGGGELSAAAAAHHPAGTPVTPEVGQQILNRLAAGDRSALAAAGVSDPLTIDPRTVHWAIAQLPGDDHVVVVRGDARGVQVARLGLSAAHEVAATMQETPAGEGRASIPPAPPTPPAPPGPPTPIPPTPAAPAEQAVPPPNNAGAHPPSAPPRTNPPPREGAVAHADGQTSPPGRTPDERDGLRAARRDPAADAAAYDAATRRADAERDRINHERDQMLQEETQYEARTPEVQAELRRLNLNTGDIEGGVRALANRREPDLRRFPPEQHERIRELLDELHEMRRETSRNHERRAALSAQEEGLDELPQVRELKARLHRASLDAPEAQTVRASEGQTHDVLGIPRGSAGFAPDHLVPVSDIVREHMDRLVLIRDRAMQVRIINGAFAPGDIQQPGPARNLRPLNPAVNGARGNRSWTTWTGWRAAAHNATELQAMQARVTALGAAETAMRREISAAIDAALVAQRRN